MGDKLTQQPIIDAAAFQKLHRRVTQAKLRQGRVWEASVFRPTQQVINGHLIEVCQSDKVFVIHFSWRVQFIAAEGGFWNAGKLRKFFQIQLFLHPQIL